MKKKYYFMAERLIKLPFIVEAEDEESAIEIANEAKPLGHVPDTIYQNGSVHEEVYKLDKSVAYIYNYHVMYHKNGSYQPNFNYEEE